MWMATFPTNVLCNYFVKIDFRGKTEKEKVKPQQLKAEVLLYGNKVFLYHAINIKYNLMNQL